MPIRAENKARYPKNWKAISAAIRERAGNRCEQCGVLNYELGGRDQDGNWLRAMPKGARDAVLEWPQPGETAWCGENHNWQQLRIVRIVLTVAHLDHQPENCDPSNLRAWCQRCHSRYDAAARRAGVRERRRSALMTCDLLEASNV